MEGLELLHEVQQDRHPLIDPNLSRTPNELTLVPV
jgi:hypothetical protein